MMDGFIKIADVMASTNFAKHSILNVWSCSEYTSYGKGYSTKWIAVEYCHKMWESLAHILMRNEMFRRKDTGKISNDNWSMDASELYSILYTATTLTGIVDTNWLWYLKQ